MVNIPFLFIPKNYIYSLNFILFSLKHLNMTRPLHQASMSKYIDRQYLMQCMQFTLVKPNQKYLRLFEHARIILVHSSILDVCFKTILFLQFFLSCNF